MFFVTGWLALKRNVITSACGAVVTKGMSVKGAPQALPACLDCLNEPHTRFVLSFVPIRDSGGDGRRKKVQA